MLATEAQRDTERKKLNLSFPKFHPLSPQPPSDVGNLNILRPPTENFGGDGIVVIFS